MTTTPPTAVRPLEDRLREYVAMQKVTVHDLGVVIKQLEAERMDINPGTAGLRETAKLLSVVIIDLEKVLAGEELKGWLITGEVPRV